MLAVGQEKKAMVSDSTSRGQSSFSIHARHTQETQKKNITQPSKTVTAVFVCLSFRFNNTQFLHLIHSINVEGRGVGARRQRQSMGQ